MKLISTFPKECLLLKTLKSEGMFNLEINFFQVKILTKNYVDRLYQL